MIILRYRIRYLQSKAFKLNNFNKRTSNIKRNSGLCRTQSSS